MNDNQYDDFKQLLTQSLGAFETRIKTELSTEIQKVRTDLGQRFDDLSAQMEDGFVAVGAPISTLNDTIDDHETRLTKLESKPI